MTRIARYHLDAHVLIVCGRNKRLATQAQKIKDSYPHLSLHIYGFVDNVDALINISDIVLTK
ncbi:MAG: hypothetical protein WCJ39_00620 [bacterium]